jgi:hypothetical protein
MGYWSIFASVDYMDEHSNYLLPMSVEQALDATEQSLTRPGRVEVQRTPDGGLVALTVKHTPAWAVPDIFVFFIRKTRRAEITVRESPRGAVVSVRGKLDTEAASNLRALCTASGRDVVPA